MGETEGACERVSERETERSVHKISFISAAAAIVAGNNNNVRFGFVFLGRTPTRAVVSDSMTDRLARNSQRTRPSTYSIASCTCSTYAETGTSRLEIMRK